MRVDRLAAATAALVLALSGCSSGGPRAMSVEERQALRTPGAPAATLSDLDDIGDLRAQFNQHQDVPQLILLLSPT